MNVACPISEAESLRSAILECAKCPRLVASRSRAVPGHGTIPAAIAFVGLAPGRLGGDRSGIPFSGDRSGNLLREMISESGLHRVFVTNLVRCNPRDEQGRNRDPDSSEIANCRNFLVAELDQASAPIVVCLGRTAWRELAGRHEPFDPTRAKPVDREGKLIYPMFHPAYVNRGAYSRVKYARDFARFRRFISKL